MNKKLNINTNNTNKEKSKSLFSRILVPENVFLFFGLVFGTYFIINTPPMQVPDERAHIKRAYFLSEFDNKITKKDTIWGIYTPASLDSIVNPFNYLLWQPQNKIRLKDIKSVFPIRLNEDNKVFSFFDANNYCFISYLPQIPAWWICRITNGSVLFYYYLGRFFSLLFYVFCIYYSIKITPIGKFVFFVIALFPMSLSLAGSFNPDSINISLCLLLISCVLNLNFNSQKLKNSYLVIIFILTLIFGMLKPVYFPLSFLIFLVPISTFRKPLFFWIFSLIGFLSGLMIAYFWYKYISYTISLPQGLISDPNYNSSIQTQKILNNPIAFVSIVKTTLKFMFSFYFKSTIGILGYLDTVLKPWMYTLCLFTLIFSILIENNLEFKFKIVHRLLFLGLGLSIIFLVFAGMFTVTALDSSIITGVQGRYFMPALFCIGISLSGLIPINLKLYENKNVFWNIVFYSMIFIILLNTVWVLQIRYFPKF